MTDETSVIFYVHGPMGCGKTHNALAICELLAVGSCADLPAAGEGDVLERISQWHKARAKSGFGATFKQSNTVLFGVDPLPNLAGGLEPHTGAVGLGGDRMVKAAWHTRGDLRVYDIPFESLAPILGVPSNWMGQTKPPKTRGKAVPLVEYVWHKDQNGNHNPQELVGDLYLHVKTSRLYVVTGYCYDATADEWSIRYKPHLKEGQFEFTRTMSDFLSDKFVKVT